MHIFFDDAISHNPTTGNSEPNDFVKNLILLVDEACLFTNKLRIKIEQPVKTPTPYGGRITILLPAGNSLFIHLKVNGYLVSSRRF